MSRPIALLWLRGFAPNLGKDGGEFGKGSVCDEGFLQPFGKPAPMGLQKCSLAALGGQLRKSIVSVRHWWFAALQMKIAILTIIAMLAFAANSVLARLALSSGGIDPLGYTGMRMVSGAAVLAALVYFRTPRGMGTGMGSWPGAFSLLLYAGAFSIAYVMVGAGPGALILFASVQIGMLAWAVFRGDRPGSMEWLGIAVAFLALVYLVSPGLVAPPLPEALLMVVAGLSWAAYSLMGRGSKSPLADTAGNFIRCLPIGIGLIVIGVFMFRPSATGIAYAMASGAIASGLGYTVWYSVLPQLSRARAAFVQLTVPSIAALGGVIFINEVLTARLVIATAGIVGGVALALMAAQHKNVTPSRPKAASN